MDAEKIGKLIAEKRKALGFTQRNIAMDLHVTNKAVSKWENGKGIPDIGLIKDLSEILGITIYELLAGEEASDKISKSDASEITKDSLEFSEKRFFAMIRKITMVSVIIILSVMLAVYFISSFNSIRIYQMYFKSDVFEMKSGFFMDSNMKNVLQISELNFAEESNTLEEMIETKIYVEDKERRTELVLYEGLNQPIYIYEQDGYEEIFTERYKDLIKNNLYVDVSYTDNAGKLIEETYNLKLELKFVNNKIFNFTIDDIPLDISSNIEKYRKDVEKERELNLNDFVITNYDLYGKELLIKDGDTYYLKEDDTYTTLVKLRDNAVYEVSVKMFYSDVYVYSIVSSRILLKNEAGTVQQVFNINNKKHIRYRDYVKEIIDLFEKS